MLKVNEIILRGYIAICEPELARKFECETVTYIPNYKRKKGDKRIYKIGRKPFYLNLKNGKIAVGYGAILSLAKVNSLFQYKISHENKKYPVLPYEFDDIPGIEKRHYVIKALDAIENSVGGLIEIPTAGGKTEVELLTCVAASKQHNVLFICPTNSILTNFVNRANKYNIDVFNYKDCKKIEKISSRGIIFYSHPINVVNDFNEGRNFPIMESIGTLISDEGHHLSNKTWQSMLYCLKNLARSFAFSGTAIDKTSKAAFMSFNNISEKDALVYNASGPVLYSIAAEDISEYIDRPVVLNLHYQWDKNKWDEKKRDRDNWAWIYKDMLNNENRIIRIAELIHLMSKMNRTTITCISRKQMGVKLLNKLKVKDAVCWYGGGEVLHVCGDKLKDEDVYEGVSSGKINHLIVTSHADEGVDIPNMSTTILSEGRNLRKQRQRAGRSSRLGDKKSIVINLYDDNYRVLKTQAHARAYGISKYYSTQVIDCKNFEHLKFHVDHLEDKYIESKEVSFN